MQLILVITAWTEARKIKLDIQRLYSVNESKWKINFNTTLCWKEESNCAPAVFFLSNGNENFSLTSSKLVKGHADVLMTCTAAEGWESSLNYRLCRQYHSPQRRANNFRGGKSQTNCVVWPKKPKLEQVTFSYCVISNTRIFHNLMISRKLNSLGDIQNYLAYTV